MPTSDLLHAYSADITKFDEDDNGDLVVYGKAAGPDLDVAQQRCSSDWLKTAMPGWMEWGNIREQHQLIAAGLGQELTEDGTDWQLKAVVIDEGSKNKVRKGLLKGFSVGIKNPRVVKSADAPGGLIVGGDIIEVSLVDRPANPTCGLVLAKSASLAEAMEPTTVEDGEAWSAPDAAEEAEVIKAATDTDDDGVSDADEAEQAATVDEIRKLVALLIQGEAAELAMGDEATRSIRALTEVLCAIENFEYTDSWEDSIEMAAKVVKTETADDPEGDKPDEEVVETEAAELTLSAVADLVKAASLPEAPEDAKLAATEIQKALGFEDLKADLAKAVEATEALTEQVAEMAKMAAPGGPSSLRTVAQADQAADRDKLLTKAADFRRSADSLFNSGDLNAAKGYRDMASDLEAQAADLK